MCSPASSVAPATGPASRRAAAAASRTRICPSREAIKVDYDEGGVIEVPQHDGSIIKLRKTKDDYDPTDRIGAMNQIQSHAAKGEVLTGLLYLNPESEDLHAHLNTYGAAFNRLGEKELCPGGGDAGENQRFAALGIWPRAFRIEASERRACSRLKRSFVKRSTGTAPRTSRPYLAWA